MIIDMLAANLDKKSEQRALRLICPNLETVPEDSLLDFESVETLEDLFLSRPNNAVLMISNENLEILKCWVQFQTLFDREPVVLTGVPSATYSSEFESEVFSLSKVAYHSAVAELIEAVRREESMTEAEKTDSIYAKERAQFTRSNGKVKEFTAFDGPNMPLGHVDADDDANAVDEDK
nr:MAG: hypothetical protein [Sichuan farmland cysto-like virus]